VTAMGEISDETKGLEMGAVDYLTKPISPPIVLARVETHLERKRQRDELKQAYRIIEAQKNRMEEELNVGRDIQMSMVPQKFPAFPDRDEFSIHAVLHPAREVGGDFYDFYFIDENRLCFCIGDVSGKGVPAALFMAVTKTLIKSRVSADPSTASIVTHVNDELAKNNKMYMFVTLFLGILNIRTGELIYTNGGHNPPYILRENGYLERVESIHGPIVGPIGGKAYKEDRTVLSKGDLLFMYTDGITEAKNAEKKLFSEERLADFLSSGKFESSEEAVEIIHSEVEAFEGDMDQADDITILAIQYLAETIDKESVKLEMEIRNQLSEINTVKHRFIAFSEDYKIPNTIRRKMNMVFDEVLNNIISYAYQDSEEHFIEVTAELWKDRLMVSISDDGIPFNPFTLEEPDTGLALEDRTIGGLGIHLVKKSMDKFFYQRRIDKNMVTLVKYIDSDG
jgi:sigma-B regulation protein RsbU (phosphoserine phosphatase)